MFSIPQLLDIVVYEFMYFYISCIWIWYDDICVSEEGTGSVPEA